VPLPKLTWDVDPVLAHLPLPGGGDFGVRYYSLLFLIVLVGGYALFEWQVRRGGGTEKSAGDFVIYGLVGVFVGARLGHILFYDLDLARRDPIQVLATWNGGLASHGAALGMVLAMYLFTRKERVPFLEGFDRFAFSAALGATLVRLGNLYNSEIVGRVTDQTWGFRFPRYLRDAKLAVVPYRHPSQLYEMALGVGVIVALLVADRAWGKEQRSRGALISLAATVYFSGRFVVEFFKENETLARDATLTMGQWLSIPAALVGAFGLWWSLKRRVRAGWNPAPR
jgi:phosphatidylglycerol---prolipoprotein diacylglyceryl transferase